MMFYDHLQMTRFDISFNLSTLLHYKDHIPLLLVTKFAYELKIQTQFLSYIICVSHFDGARLFNFLLQWNIQQTKYKLAVKCKLAKLTSDPWETLDDFSNLYKGSLNMPYVSYMAFV